MNYSQFITIIAITYFTYYGINIILDLIGKPVFLIEEEGHVEFDVGGPGPRKASLDADDNFFQQPDGLRKQEVENQREETFSETQEEHYGRLGVDLRLEDVLPQEIYNGTDRPRKRGQHY
jgi:hypothetical protein